MNVLPRIGASALGRPCMDDLIRVPRPPESTISLKAKEPNQTEVDYNLKDIFFPDEVNTLTWKEDNVSLKKSAA